jgi:sugar phosphate isomerase/epimerase
MDYAEEMDVKFALDNHGLTTNKAELQLEVLSRVNSPRMGLNLDTMNYRWFGHDLETVDRYYDMVGPHVFHVHLKDGRGSLAQYQGTALGEGEIHLERAIRALKSARYRGAWCAEYEGPQAESADGYRRCLAWMQAHVTG